MVVRAVSVMFLSVYLMAGNHLTVSAANGEKISEDSDFSVSGENMDSLLNSLDLSRIEAFLREAGGSAVPGLSFREILSMLLSGNYQSVVLDADGFLPDSPISGNFRKADGWGRSSFWEF